jgi:hypothetical protein
MTEQKRTMTEDEEAEYLYAHRNDADLVGEEVDLKPAEPLTLVVSVRLREAEMRTVVAAAETAGMTVSAFIRQAAVDAAGRAPVDREAVVKQIAAVERDLAEVRRLVS